MTHADYALTALTLWREDRSGGATGMTAVGCVIRNRVNRDKSTFFAEVTRRLQFSALTAGGDPELTLFPTITDPQWELAQTISQGIIDGTISDVTQGAVSYYALSMKTPPSWAASMTHTITIGGQIYFR